MPCNQGISLVREKTWGQGWSKNGSGIEDMGATPHPIYGQYPPAQPVGDLQKLQDQRVIFL